MRKCSNPICRKPIRNCNGTTKAGDILECLEGKRKPEEVRELCERCATWMVGLESQAQDVKSLHLAFGWG